MARKIEIEVVSKTKDFSRGMGETKKGLAGITKAAGTAGLAIAGGLAIGIEKSVKAASQFQSQMELIQTQAGGTTEEIHKMSKALLLMAADVGQTPDNLAKGLYHIESAGLRGAKALSVLRAAAMGAAVGHADLESVTNALVAAQKSAIKGAGSMTHAMGVLNAIVGAGNMRMEDLTGAMSTGVLAAAKTFGISIQEVGAALATMTVRGMPAQEAATRLRMAFSLLAAPSAKAIGLLDSIGLSQDRLANDMRKRGLIFALGDLKKHLVDSGLSATRQAQLLSMAFGGGRTSAGIMTLVGAVGDMKNRLDSVNATTSSFGENWKQTQKTSQFQTERLKASVSALEVEIGAKLLPTVTAITNKLTVFTEYMSKHTTLTKVAIVALGGLATALIAASVAQHLLNLAVLANPYVAAIVGIVAIGVAIYVFRDKIMNVFNWIKNHWPLLTAIIVGPIGLAVLGIVQHRDRIVQIFTDLPGQIANAFTSGIGLVKDAIVGLFHKVIGWVKGALGISSPSKVFEQIGKDAILGFVKGVGGSAGVLEKAVKGMVTSLPGKALGALGSAFGGGGTKAPGGFGGGQGTADSYRKFAISQLSKFGWGTDQFAPLNALWNQESGWNPEARNPSSNAGGIPQAYPYTKMPRVAWPHWAGGAGNAFAQILWGMNYIKGRYGSPARAWAQDVAGGLKGYALGGTVPGMRGEPRLAIVHGGEKITPPGSVRGAGGGGGTTILQFSFPNLVGSEREMEQLVHGALDTYSNRNGGLALGGGF